MNKTTQKIVLIAGLATLAFCLFRSTGHGADVVAQATVQYRVELLPQSQGGKQQLLDKCGKDGWQLVLVDGGYYVFKR